MKFSALVLGLMLCSFSSYSEESRPAPQTNVRDVDSLLSSLSTEQKVGQLLMIGVHGYELNDVNKEKLRELRPGGIILFGRNIKSAVQVSNFLFDIQEEAHRQNLPPIFTAIDQEGGAVTRLKSWPPLPSAAAVGRAGDLDLAFKLALFTGQLMKTLGLNTNLAPVLDLADPHQRSFIGSRSYGETAETVARFGGAVISGFASAGVMTVSKHFPGHGGAVADSHLETPVVRKSLTTLKDTDLIPFVDLTKRGRLPGVMAAHIAFPLVDSSNLPATFSRIFLTDYLRKEIAYPGIIMTDDLEMIGAKGIRDPAERAVRAILAGADVIMVAWNPPSQKKAFDGILAAVKSGRISASRLDESVRRVLKTKYEFNLDYPQTRPSKNELEVLIAHRELRRTIDRIVKKNLSLSSVDNIEQIFTADRETLIISDDPRFSESVQKAFPHRRVRALSFSQNEDPSKLAERLREYPKYYVLLFYAGSRNSLIALSRFPASVRQRLYVVTSELPYQIRAAGDFRGIFYSYTRHPDLGGLFYSALANAAAGLARLPAEDQSTVRRSDGRQDYQ